VGTQIAKMLESPGVIVSSKGTVFFVNAMADLAGNAEHRPQLGKNARDYAVEYLDGFQRISGYRHTPV